MRRKFRNIFPGILKVFNKSRSCKKYQIFDRELIDLKTNLKYCISDAGEGSLVCDGIHSEHVNSPLLRVLQNLRNKTIIMEKITNMKVVKYEICQ